MAKKNYYDEDFKRTLVELYHNGKTQASLIKEYGVSQTALSRWIKQYSTVETSNAFCQSIKIKHLFSHLDSSRRYSILTPKNFAIF